MFFINNIAVYFHRKLFHCSKMLKYPSVHPLIRGHNDPKYRLVFIPKHYYFIYIISNLMFKVIITYF